MKAGDKIKFDIEKTKVHKKQYIEMWHHQDEIDNGLLSDLDEIIENPDREFTVSEVMFDESKEAYVLCRELDFFIPCHLIDL